MKLNRLGWRVFALSMWMAALASAVVQADKTQDGTVDTMVGQPQNGLSSFAFRRNALTVNPRALRILKNNSLSTSLKDPYIRDQLKDSNARAMMTEIVKCALDRKERLFDPEGQFPEWRGELGLCPNWHDSAAGPQCEQLVTACVMARVNALHKAIPLSMRGSVGSPSLPRPRVPTVTTFRESREGSDPAEGLPIASFDACDSPGGADCDWVPASVGKCPIEFHAPTNSGSMQLRICAGIHGCNKNEPAPRHHPYVKHLKDFDAASMSSLAAHTNQFPCPAEAPDALGAQNAYYSIMVRGGTSQSGDLLEQHTGSGIYPAPESEVFTYLEGAFYGNLFEPDSLNETCSVERTQYGAMLVCEPLPVGTGRPEFWPIRRNMTCTSSTCDGSGSDGSGSDGSGSDGSGSNGSGSSGSGSSGSGAKPLDGLFTKDVRALLDELKKRKLEHSVGRFYDDKESDRKLIIGSGSSVILFPGRGSAGGGSAGSGSPYRDVYACYSLARKDDDVGVDYLNSRICDQPEGAQCFTHPPVPCSGRSKNDAPCTWMNSTGRFQDCHAPADSPGASKTIFQPITTYLNDPCDLIGEGKLCDRIRHPGPPDPSSCCGCLRACSACEALVVVVMGAVLLLILLRRRRHRS